MPNAETFTIFEGTQMPNAETFLMFEGTQMPRPETRIVSEGTQVPKAETVINFRQTEISKVQTFINFEGTEMPKAETFITFSRKGDAKKLKPPSCSREERCQNLEIFSIAEGQEMKMEQYSLLLIWIMYRSSLVSWPLTNL